MEMVIAKLFLKFVRVILRTSQMQTNLQKVWLFSIAYRQSSHSSNIIPVHSFAALIEQKTGKPHFAWWEVLVNSKSILRFEVFQQLSHLLQIH